MTRKEKIEYVGDFCGKHEKCSSCPLDEKINGTSYCPIDCSESCTDGEIDAIIDIIDMYTATLPQNEEINHPDRYANGKYECIDVMVDVFGVEAAKAFCKLNVFKYLWREEHKNGLQDVKKAAWYINKYIELSESGDEENV